MRRGEKRACACVCVIRNLIGRKEASGKDFISTHFLFCMCQLITKSGCRCEVCEYSALVCVCECGKVRMPM